MNIEIAKKGHSFKGAFSYYLHDKGAQTTDRVAWSETRNLAADDPAFAQSVMIATARQADALKEAAGVKATGRKATAGPVYAFSLSWHPSEAGDLDRAEMVRAADAALQVLKAEHLQAVIVCHRDTDHPHVHVILNRVNPANGISEGFNKDRDRLDEWADAYERERGRIVSPKRAKKYDDRRKRAQDQQRRKDEKLPPAPSRSPDHVAPANQSTPVSPSLKSRAVQLAQEQEAQKARHKQEWVDLADANKARRDTIYAQRIDFKAIAARHRAETKPLWSQLGKAQAAERRVFQSRERRILGIVRNAIDTAEDQLRRGVTGDRGFWAMAVSYTLSPAARRASLEVRQKDAKDALARSLDVSLIAKFDAVKAQRAGKLAEANRIYQAARAALIERQNTEAGTIRAAWRQLYVERERAGEAHPPFTWRRRTVANDRQKRAPAPIKEGFERSAQRDPASPAPVSPSRIRESWGGATGSGKEVGRRMGLAREGRTGADRLRRPGRDFDRGR